MIDTLLAMVRAQQRGCAIGGSALYSSLLDDVHDDVARGGPCAQALASVARERPADAGILRFLRAVHELVLAGDAPELARHYPSVGGEPGPELGADFVATVAAHAERIRVATRPPLQTNEVGRSATLVGGFLTIAERMGPRLALLEVGASAGLNLRWDHYRYEQGTRAVGPIGSPVRFVDPWARARPLPPLETEVEVVRRRGCDAHPVDLSDPEACLRLRASIWPDQPDRRDRFDAARAVAAQVPAPIDEADAGVWVEEHLRARPAGVTTVIFHSIVLQYLPGPARAALRAEVERAGRAASPDAPLAWLRMEPAGVREAEVRLRCWPDPDRRGDEVLARSGFHGPPVRWRPQPRGAGGVPRSSG